MKNAAKSFLWSQGVGLWLFIRWYCYWPHVVYLVQCWLRKRISVFTSITFSGKRVLHSNFSISCCLHFVLWACNCLGAFLHLSIQMNSTYRTYKMLSTDSWKINSNITLFEDYLTYNKGSCALQSARISSCSQVSFWVGNRKSVKVSLVISSCSFLSLCWILTITLTYGYDVYL